MSCRDQACLDAFFETLSDYFFNTIETGLLAASEQEYVFESKHTSELFRCGAECLADAVSPCIVEYYLETKMHILMRDSILTDNEIQEMVLLKKLLLLIQAEDIKSYLEYPAYIMSRQRCCLHEMRFSKYWKPECQSITICSLRYEALTDDQK